MTALPALTNARLGYLVGPPAQTGLHLAAPRLDWLTDLPNGA